MTADEKIKELLTALGSCYWVLQNAHNGNLKVYENLAQAALDDVRSALETTGLSLERRP